MTKLNPKIGRFRLGDRVRFKYQATFDRAEVFNVYEITALERSELDRTTVKVDLRNVETGEVRYLGTDKWLVKLPDGGAS